MNEKRGEKKIVHGKSHLKKKEIVKEVVVDSGGVKKKRR